jgi:RNA recognition motif-containing protein
MSLAVFVGNIPWSVDQKELSDHMSQCGQVEQVVIPQFRGRSKGFGIVTYTTPEDATRAISELDGSSLRDRTINVSESHQQQPSSAIFVGNLAWEVTWQELKDYFREVGEVVHADVLKNYNGSSRGCGIVEFQSPAQAQEAIATLNQSEFKGRTITVREHHQKNQRQQNKPNRGFNRRHNSRPTTYRSNYYDQPKRKYSHKSNSNYSGSNIRREIEHVEPAQSIDVSRRVYVSNLPYRLQWQELKDYMRTAGLVTNVNIFKNSYDGRSKGCGIVEFQTSEGAQAAIKNLNNREFHGRPLSVQADRGQRKPKTNTRSNGYY